jgi:4-hydroxy-tetrahydrodipicolinate synthase
MAYPALPLGVLPVLQTPFDDSGAIDHSALQREIDWVFERGADGVTVAMVSEILRLSLEERRELAETVCSTAGTRAAVISVGAESTRLAVDLTEHADRVGASAVMAVPPLLVALSDREIEYHYESIAGSTDLPLIVQDASAYVGRALSIDLLARLHERYGDKIGFKPEAQPLGPRLSELLQATAGKAGAYDGSGGIALVDTHRRGIIGTMPSADLCWAIVRLWEHLERGDYHAAYQLSLPLVALVSMQTSLDGYVVIEKYLLAKQKVLPNMKCRGPLGFHLDEFASRQLDTYLELLTRAYEDSSKSTAMGKPPRAD